MTEDQQSACQILLELEDLYLQKLSEGAERKSIEPLRNSISWIQQHYNIDDNILSEYDKYTRLARREILYADLIKESSNSD